GSSSAPCSLGPHSTWGVGEAAAFQARLNFVNDYQTSGRNDPKPCLVVRYTSVGPRIAGGRLLPGNAHRYSALVSPHVLFFTGTIRQSALLPCQCAISESGLVPPWRKTLLDSVGVVMLIDVRTRQTEPEQPPHEPAPAVFAWFTTTLQEKYSVFACR